MTNSQDVLDTLESLYWAREHSTNEERIACMAEIDDRMRDLMAELDEAYAEARTLLHAHYHERHLAVVKARGESLL